MDSPPTVPALEPTISEEAWSDALRLPCQLSVLLSIPGFRVRDLLGLEVGAVLETQHGESANVPLQLNGRIIALGEFEVVGDRLAVRLTELA